MNVSLARLRKLLLWRKRSLMSSSCLADLVLVSTCFKTQLWIGKGTVSSTLKEKLGWVPISAGDCLREEKAR